MALPGEALGWRPHFATDDKDRLLPLALTGGDETALHFDFKHPVLLNRLTLHVGSEVFDKDAPDFSTGRWKVQAQARDGRWNDASAAHVVGSGAYALDFELDTQQVPHRAYRLLGMDGFFPRDAWFTETTFSTAEATVPAMDDEAEADGIPDSKTDPAGFISAMFRLAWGAMAQDVSTPGTPAGSGDAPLARPSFAQLGVQG
ncbi:hypothetical protein [Roseateles chitinivorans]|uniref:hypothetical protein n=1 Tax=Roseateles chitinivorans TaxID=2917965 RepID=UPI003D67D78B